jgi:heme/copper-type cytochrome/quinol oxidase subunit 2
MRSNKTCLWIAAGLILLCAIIFLLSMVIVPRSAKASTYGITDKDQAALVIYNRTADFYVLDISLQDGTGKKLTNLIHRGDFGVFEIPPGEYSVIVHYSDEANLDNLSYMEWYVSSVIKKEIEVKAGRAVRFTLTGGDVSGMFYEPPELLSGDVKPDKR